MVDTITPDSIPDGRDDELPAPKYRILKVLTDVEEPGLSQKMWHVKLSHKHVVRKVGTSEYVQTDYVVVGSSRIERAGGVYQETLVIASDEDGASYEAILYLAPRQMEVFEALFAIGEI